MSEFSPVSQFLDAPSVNYWRALLDAEKSSNKKNILRSSVLPVSTVKIEQPVPTEACNRGISTRCALCLPPRYRIFRNWDDIYTCDCLNGQFLLSSNYNYLNNTRGSWDTGTTRRRSTGTAYQSSPVPFVSPMLLDLELQRSREGRSLPLDLRATVGESEVEFVKKLQVAKSRIKDQHFLLHAIKDGGNKDWETDNRLLQTAAYNHASLELRRLPYYWTIDLVNPYKILVGNEFFFELITFMK